MSIHNTAAPQGNVFTHYQDILTRKGSLTLILVLVLLVLICLSLALGAARIGPADLLSILFGLDGQASPAHAHILLTIRLPRVVLAIIGGMGLAISGTVMQAVLRNPLASSYTLGISSGAGFGAALAIGLGLGLSGGKYLVVANAFVFGLASMFLVYGLASIKGSGPGMLILAGIAISHLFTALIAVVKYVVEHDIMAGIVFWLMGGLNLANWENIGLLLPLVLVPSLILAIKYPWDLNSMGSGDEIAISLGVNPQRTRIVVLVLAALITSSIVAFTGVIGFVCLVGPHMARMMIGSDHRFLLPFSCLTGAILLLGADTAARTIIQPTELPVGIVTSLLGVPFFLHLLIKSRRYWS